MDNFQNESTNPTPGWISPRVLVCPTDPNQEGTNPGYLLINNISGAGALSYQTQNFPISYGINADIACILNGSTGVFNPGSTVSVTGGNNQPLQCKIDRVAFATQTLLFGDCGTRPTHATFGSTEANALDLE